MFSSSFPSDLEDYEAIIEVSVRSALCLLCLFIDRNTPFYLKVPAIGSDVIKEQAKPSHLQVLCFALADFTAIGT